MFKKLNMGDMDMKKIKKGFTLAEVLITLGIIGVVAALTIPTFMQKYRMPMIGYSLVPEDSIIQEKLLRLFSEDINRK